MLGSPDMFGAYTRVSPPPARLFVFSLSWIWLPLSFLPNEVAAARSGPTQRGHLGI